MDEMRALLLVLALIGSVLAAPTRLQLERAAVLKAVNEHSLTHPGLTQRCGPLDSVSHNDVYAFPTGRADRVYIGTLGQAFAYRVSGGTAKLVWCGSAALSGEQASRLSGTVVKAFAEPLRTASGTFPIERGGMDAFRHLVDVLTSERLDAKGKTVCSKTYSLSASDLAIPSYSPVNFPCP